MLDNVLVIMAENKCGVKVHLAPYFWRLVCY